MLEEQTLSILLLEGTLLLRMLLSSITMGQLIKLF